MRYCYPGSRRHSLMVFLLLAACGGDPPTPPPPPPPPPPGGIPADLTVSADADTLESLGDVAAVSAIAVDSDGNQIATDSLVWTSSDPAIVSVSADGQATAVANGTAHIIGTLATVSDSAAILVLQRPASVDIQPEQFRFSAVGETRRFIPAAVDAGGAPLQISPAWSTSDTLVAVVDAGGTVTARGNGASFVTIAYAVDTVRFGVSVVAPVAFVHANLIPMDQPGMLVDYDVVIADDRISAMGPSGSVTLPGGAFQVDASGKYLMPGLTDMHVHLTCQTFRYCDGDMFLYLANGVTSVRNMWGSRGFLILRNDVASGFRLGPAIFLASPGMDGPGGGFANITPVISTPAEARSTVAAHVAAGYDFIKVYNDLANDVYHAIINEAALQGIRVIGHMPGALTFAEITAAGQWTSEHVLSYELETSPTGSFFNGSPDLNLAQSLATMAAQASMAETPTLFINTRLLSLVPGYRASPEARYVSPGFIDQSDNGLRAWNVSQAVADTRLQHLRDVVGIAHRTGVPMLLGTDAGVRWTIPGFSIVGELQQMVQAGLTPFEALEAGTVNAALYLDASADQGTITAGKRADLLLLDADPLADIGNVSQIAGVMAGGVWLPQAVIQRRLEEIARSYGR